MSCLSLKQFIHFFLSTNIIMRSLSFTQKSRILSMLDARHSIRSIQAFTSLHASTISRLCSKEHSELQKSIGGRPSKLSPPNIHHTIHLISTQKAENAVQVTKTLSNIINKPFSLTTVHYHLKKAGMKAVVKTKHPLLSAKHHKACLDFAYAYKDWTVKD